MCVCVEKCHHTVIMSYVCLCSMCVKLVTNSVLFFFFFYIMYDHWCVCVLVCECFYPCVILPATSVLSQSIQLINAPHSRGNTVLSSNITPLIWGENTQAAYAVVCAYVWCWYIVGQSALVSWRTQNLFHHALCLQRHSTLGEHAHTHTYIQT